MTIREVCEKYHVSPDTLRYYERAGAIPAVNRSKNGIRDYTEEDLGYVENALCMRNAGVPVEMVARYMQLCREGDETLSARCELLKEARSEILYGSSPEPGRIRRPGEAHRRGDEESGTPLYGMPLLHQPLPQGAAHPGADLPLQ